MLTLTISGEELWDERKEEFIPAVKDRILTLEHSLVSISKWEAKWHKPYLFTKNKTYQETIDYIRFMTLTQNVEPDTYLRISAKNIDEVNEYIDDPMTATVFYGEQKAGKSRKIITSEYIYFLMITHGIPFDPCQKWHLNRLLTLIRICSVENTQKEMMPKNQVLQSNAALNAARRKAWNTTG